jgi:hypothetical protein
MARKQRAEQWADHRRRRDEDERRQRVMVITEFDTGDPEATMHALADELLKYRRAERLLAKAIGWADVGAPFALIAPRLSLAFEAHHRLLKCPTSCRLRLRA